MAQDIQPQATERASLPQPIASPTSRDLRAQSVHRLQVGLFGLCAMLLLVGLANIIMDRARLAEEFDPAVSASPSGEEGAQPASDPLADIGVVPAAGPSTPATVQKPAKK